MLSIELIRRDPDLVRQALESRGEQDPLAGLLDLDAQRRQAVAQGDELRAQRNQVSRQLGQERAAGREPSAGNHGGDAPGRRPDSGTGTAGERPGRAAEPTAAEPTQYTPGRGPQGPWTSRKTSYCGSGASRRSETLSRCPIGTWAKGWG